MVSIGMVSLELLDLEKNKNQGSDLVYNQHLLDGESVDGAGDYHGNPENDLDQYYKTDIGIT